MSCNRCAQNNNIDTSRPPMLDTHDWLNDLPDTSDISDIVEVRFKSTRKEYFRNTNNLFIKRNDTVVVATLPGHDVGVVTLTGVLADKQFQRKTKNKGHYTLNTIYRIATRNDISNWDASKKREKQVMIQARKIVEELGLAMKVGDVEFRGDGGKAIFYYIADDRVDFRELIKIYAREFQVRIEMKQIGARQEAGRIGGIGSCGRELCCSSWLTDFSSISTEAISKQGLSSSASKLAGACGKLKCCLLYELDAYIEAGKEFPAELLTLETSKGSAKPFKTDYLAKTIWYIFVDKAQNTIVQLSTEEVKKVIQQNKRGIKPDIGTLEEKDEPVFQLAQNELPENKKDNSKRRKKKWHKKRQGNANIS